MEIEARQGRQIEVGIGVVPQWDRAQTLCVFRPPLSLMKANQLGWQRRVPQEESHSTEPNEPGLEIREVGKVDREGQESRGRKRWRGTRENNKCGANA